MDMYRFEMLEYRGKMPLPLKNRKWGIGYLAVVAIGYYGEVGPAMIITLGHTTSNPRGALMRKLAKEIAR